MFHGLTYFIRILVVFSTLALVACQPSVRTNITTFRADVPLSKGEIRVIPKELEKPADLEFKYYKTRLEEYLRKQGYEPVERSETAYVARLGYSVSRQEKDKPHSRILVGGHYGYYSPGGTLIMSDSLGPEFEFVRELSLSIGSAEAEDSADIVDITATSIGKCQYLTIVYDEMLDAIFSNMERANGSIETVTTRGDLRCR